MSDELYLADIEALAKAAKVAMGDDWQAPTAQEVVELTGQTAEAGSPLRAIHDYAFRMDPATTLRLLEMIYELRRGVDREAFDGILRENAEKDAEIERLKEFIAQQPALAFKVAT